MIMNQNKNSCYKFGFIGQTLYPLFMILFSAEYNSNIKQDDELKFKKISCEYYYPFIYIFSIAIFQYLANKIASSRTIKQRLIFCNIFIQIVMPCLPLIQKYTYSKYDAFTINCLLICSVAMTNAILIHTQLELFLHYNQSKQDFEKKKFQFNQFHGLAIFSFICLVYIIVRQFYTTEDGNYFYYSFGLMFGLMYILNLIGMLSFLNWLKQFDQYQKVINNASNHKLQIHLIDILANSVYLDHQMIIDGGQSFSEVSSFDSLLSNSQQKETNIALKVSLKDQLRLDSNTDKINKNVNYEKVITNSQSQKIDKYCQDYIEQSQYNEIRSKMFWVLLSVFLQLLITAMFIIPFFQVDPIFKLEDCNEPDDCNVDQIYDKSIKVIVFVSCQYIGTIFKEQFINYNKKHFIIVTLIRTLVVTPVYMYVCMSESIDSKTKLIVQPVIMCISWLMYFGSMDINQVIISYQRHNVYALKEQHRIRIGKSLQGTSAAGIMIGVILSVAMIKLPQAISN